jgi:hypothetical protein
MYENKERGQRARGKGAGARDWGQRKAILTPYLLTPDSFLPTPDACLLHFKNEGASGDMYENKERGQRARCRGAGR